jgi:Tol biopolymer transport system component
MDADGTDPVQLTFGPKIDERPDWSPNGARLTFSRNGNIWIVDADGTDALALTHNRRPEFNPTFAPDGTQIAYSRIQPDDRVGIWLMASDGSGPDQLTFGRLDFFPDWQPV